MLAIHGGLSDAPVPVEHVLIDPAAPSTPRPRPPAPAKRRLRVAYIMVGYMSYFTTPEVRESMIEHGVKPLRRSGHDVSIFLCMDTRGMENVPQDFIAREGITVLNKTMWGRRQFIRKRWCYKEIEKRAGTFDWAVQTRPDNYFFADIPPLEELPADRIYGRLRACGREYTRRWNLTSLHFSFAYSDPREIACWGSVRDWQKDCAIADDQINYIPWKFMKAVNKGGSEWGGFPKQGIPLDQREVVAPTESQNAGYKMCVAAFPGEGFFTRAMLVGKVPYQPLEFNVCLGKNVYHPRRRREDCQPHARQPDAMKMWVKRDIAPTCDAKKRGWEEWESDALLCNVSSKKKYTGNAAC